MKNESPGRRRQIADAIVSLLGVGVHAIVERGALEPAASLILGLDHTLLARDSRVIATASRALVADQMAYSHLPLAAEPRWPTGP